MDALNLEARYLERARDTVGERARAIEVVLPDRLPPPSGQIGLSGWWTRDPAPDGRVVLPNPYDAEELVAAMESWVWEVVERVIPALGRRLDGLVGEPERPMAYWHTVLAPWLVHLVSALADRRLFCLAGLELVPEAPLLVPAAPGPPATMGGALARLRTDLGNGGLLAVVAPHLGFRLAAGTRCPPPVGSPAGPRGPGLREIACALPAMAVEAALGALPRRRVALVGLTRLSAADLLRLEQRVHGLVPRPLPSLRPAEPEAPGVDPSLRGRLGLGDSNDPLEHLLLQCLPQLLPQSLLEGFAEVQRISRRRYGRPVSTLVGNYSVDEVQNEFLARCRVAGRPLAFVQHGGMYLQSPVNAQERLEVEPGSVFLSWGARRERVLPTPNPYLERLRDTHRGGSRITLVEALEPPDAYVVRFAGHPQGNQAYETAQMLAELAERLSESRRVHLALKRFPNPVATPSRPAVLAALPADGPPGGAATWMAQSRLVVIPYLDTPFIEALVMGTPTIGLWNPRRWPLLEEVRPLFERLREVGVVHANPASAAAHIDRVYDNVDAWWGREDVRSARAGFVRRFAVSGDWLEAWAARLRQLAKPD